MADRIQTTPGGYDHNAVQSWVSRGGHIDQSSDAPDDAYRLFKHKDGHHVWLQPDGSIQITSVKVPADNKNGGKMKISVWGDAMVLVRQDCDIEVRGDTRLECDGNIEAHSTGDLKLGSEGNIKLMATKNIEIHAQQAIGLGAKAKLSIDTPRIEENTDMKKTNVSGPLNDVIDGERTLEMSAEKGTFHITSKGHMIQTVKGDYQLIVGGRSQEKVGGKIPKVPLPAMGGQKQAKSIEIGAEGGDGKMEKVVIGNSVETVTVGNKTTNVAAGNMTTAVGAGTYTVAAGVNAPITGTKIVTIAGAPVFLN